MRKQLLVLSVLICACGAGKKDAAKQGEVDQRKQRLSSESVPFIRYDINLNSANPADVDAYLTQPGNQNWTLQLDRGAATAVAVGSGADRAWELNSLAPGLDPGKEERWSVPVTAHDMTLGRALGWTLSARIRMPTSGDAVGNGVAVQYYHWPRFYTLLLGTDASGNAQAQVYGDPRPAVTIPGGAIFHHYELTYDPAVGTAHLRVDGTVVLSNITGDTAGSATAAVMFGDLASSDNGHGQYQWVQWRIHRDEHPPTALPNIPRGTTRVRYEITTDPATHDPTQVDAHLIDSGVQPWVRQTMSVPTATPLVDGTVAALDFNSKLGWVGQEDRYVRTLSTAEVTAAQERGWSLKVRTRMLRNDDTVGWGVAAQYFTGTRIWSLLFGRDSAGRPIIGSADDPRTVTVDQPGFHTYELVYNPATGTASIVVDNAVRLTDVPGQTWSDGSGPTPTIMFGDIAQADDGHGQFQLVEWTVPEPGSSQGTDITFVPNGYQGPICIGAVACMQGSAIVMNLPDGTHTISAGHTGGVDGSTSPNLGSITVNRATNTISLSGADAIRIFDRLNSVVSVRSDQVLDVRYNSNGAIVPISLNGLNYLTSAPERLLRGRRYRLNGGWSWHPQGHGFFFSDRNDLEIGVDGSVQLVTGTDAAILFEGSTATGTLTLRSDQVASVPYQSNGSPVPISIWGLNQFDQQTPMRLIRRRHYRLNGGASWNPQRGDSLFSASLDLEVRADGTVGLLPGTDAAAIFTTSGSTLILPQDSLSNVTYQANGSPVIVLAWALDQLRPTTPLKLIRGRRYMLDAVYSWNPATQQTSFSSGPDLDVLASGALALVPGSAAAGIFQTSGESLVLPIANTADVTYQASGSPVPVEISGLHNFNTASTVRLMRNRRYALFGSGSYDPQTGASHFSTTPDLDVVLDGSVALVDGTKAARQFLPVPGTATFRPVLGQLTVNPNGYPNSVCLGGATCGGAGAGLSVTVIPGRRYVVNPPGTQVEFRENGTCDPLSLPPTGLTVSCSPFVGQPAAPALLRSSIVTTSSIHLRWVDSSVNEASFGVERAPEGSSNWTPVVPCDVGPNVTSCTDQTGLVQGARYQYRVYAQNGQGRAYAPALTVLFDRPDPPTALVGDATTPTEVTLRWTDNSLTEQGFHIERSDNGVAYGPPATVEADVRQFVDTTVANGATYHYRVRAYNAFGDSLPSNVPIISVGVPGPPSNVQARLLDWIATTGPVHVTWNDNSSNETGFFVERSSDGGMSFIPIGETGRDMGGPTGGFVDWVGQGTYVYRIAALSAIGASAGAVSPPIVVGPVSAPTLSATVVSQTRVDLSWSELTSATAATLYRSVDGGGFAQVAALTLPASGYSDMTTTADHTYAYRLDVSNLLGSASSNVVTVSTAVPAAPTELWATITTQGIVTVNWNYANGIATGFDVQFRVGTTGSFTPLQSVGALVRSVNHSGRSANQTLNYQVRARNAAGIGAWSSTFSTVTAVPSAPTAPSAAILSSTQVRIRWTDNSSNENGFIVSRQPTGGVVQDLPTTAPRATEFIDTNAVAGTEYTYRVRATNAYGSSSTVQIPALRVAVPPPAANLAAVVAGPPAAVNLTWTNGSNGATAIRLERTAVGAATPTVFSLALGATSYSDATAVVGTTYDYRVVSENPLGTSGSTIQVPFAVPIAPTNLTGTVVSGTQVNLSWQFTGTQHQRFRLERATGTGSFTLVSDQIGAAARTYNNSGAPASSSLRYRIMAINGVGTGAASSEFATSTAPPVAPTGVLAKVTSGTQVAVSWTDMATTEQNYRVERAPTSTGSWTIAVNNLPANTQSANVSGLTANTTYYFRAVAYNGAGVGNGTPDGTRTAAVGTAGPTGFTATAQGPSRVRLAWTLSGTVTNENGFEIQRRVTGTTQWSPLATAERKLRAFDDNTAQPGTSYQYQIRAFNGISPPSNFVMASVTLPGSCEALINGTPCNDGNECTTVDTCQGGVCVGGSPRICTGGSACVASTCDPADGQCKLAPRPPGTTCDDSNACTSGDTCNGSGTCGGTAKSCSDGNACTVDSCQPSTGMCTNTASSCSVIPLAACTITDAAGAPVAVFGYSNGAATNTEMAYGANNQMDPPAMQGRQPRWFKPGTNEAAFAITIPAGTTIRWTLGSQTVTASASTGPCTGTRATAANNEFLLNPEAVTSSLVATEDLGAGQTIGGIDGDLDVTHTGDAQYEVPLNVPAGRLGIEPNLTLVYNSDLGKNDGLLGAGWMLQGLSRIHRCPRTLAQDGDASAVSYTRNDAYCLDGQRLAPIQTMPDGRVEYRTERDSYARIVGSSPEISGPRVFTVRTSQGKVLTYGFPTTGDPLANAVLADRMARYATFDFVMTSATAEQPKYEEAGATPLRTSPTWEDHFHFAFFDWPLTEVRDRFGNSLRVSYLTSRGPREEGFEYQRLPDEITYTHHPSLAGRRKVRFKYVNDAGQSRAAIAPRDAKIVTYAGGVRTVASELISEIEMWAPNPVQAEKVRSYKIDYRVSASTQRPLISTIRECDARNICKPATSFDYTTSDPGWERINTTITVNQLLEGGQAAFRDYQQTPGARLFVGDLNGDGRDDVLYRKYNSVLRRFQPFYHAATERGFGPAVQISVQELEPVASNISDVESLIDIDGDGQVELGLLRNSWNDVCKLQSTSNPAVVNCPLNQSSWSLESGFWSTHLVNMYADLNGDGWPEAVRTLEDLFFHVRPNVRGVLDPYAQFTTDQLSNERFVTQPFYGVRPVDINNDGRDEVLIRLGGNAKYSYRGRNADGSVNAGSTNMRVEVPSSMPNHYVDVNGDGLVDVVYVEQSIAGDRLAVQMNTGRGFLPPRFPSIGSVFLPSTNYALGGSDTNVRELDYDGNGTTDLLLVDNARGRQEQRVLKFMPDGTVESVATGIPIGEPAGIGSTIGDLKSFQLTQTLDANGDGLTDLIQYEAATSSFVLYVRRGKPADLLTTVTKPQGGGSLTVDYDFVGNVNRPGLFTQESGCMAGLICAKSRLWVVSDVRRDNGGVTADFLHTTYSYDRGHYSRTGHGFLGFVVKREETSRIDAIGRINTRVTTRYRSHIGLGNHFPTVGMPDTVEKRVDKVAPEGTTRHETLTSFTLARLQLQGTGQFYELLPQGRSTIQYESQPGQPTVMLSTVTDSRTYTSYGRIATWTKRTFRTGGPPDGHVQTVTYEDFFPDDVSPTDMNVWTIGPPRRVIVGSQAAGVSALPRTTTYVLDPTTLFIQQEIREPNGNADERLVTTYTPSPTGNGLVVGVSSVGGGDTRTLSVDYDALEQLYPHTQTNGLGMRSTTLYHPAIDALAMARDPNGILIRHVYDTLGRIRQKDMPAGEGDTFVTFSTAPPRVEVRVEGGTTTETEYDRVGRAVRQRYLYSGGSVATKTSEYDSLGRPWRVSRPFGPGELPIYTQFEYDELGRPTAVLAPGEDGYLHEQHRITYSGLRATSVDASGRRRYVEKDERGLLVKTVEYLEEDNVTKEVTTEHDYGPWSLLSETRVRPGATAAPTIVTTLHYDRLGRRRETINSDRGTVINEFNPFDEVREVRDAGGAATVFRYDAIGRLRERSAPDGLNTWSYDSAVNGIGAVAATTSSDGVVEDFSYDSSGRLASKVTRLTGQSFELAYGYDLMGRVNRISYPETPGWPRFEVRQNYFPSSGEPSSVQRIDTGAVLWQAYELDPTGRVVDEAAGQALTATYTYSPLTGLLSRIQAFAGTAQTLVDDLSYSHYNDGNIRTRSNAVTGLREHFKYDDLSRLEEWTSADTAGNADPSTWQVRYAYDEIGNMRTRTMTAAGGRSQIASYRQDGGPNAGPSALTSWGFSTDGGPTLTGTFAYDVNHRIRQHPRLGTIDYNSYDLPIRMRGGTVEADFGYNASGSRAFKREGTVTTLYAGGLYEMRVKPGDVVEHVLNIPGGNRTVGQINRTRAASGALSESANFYSIDSLGTVTTVLDAAGGVIERRKTDPFGNWLRDSAVPMLETQSLIMSVAGSSTRVGFTGQEHDEALGLINMKGRIYEPLAGRFLSPDPVGGSESTSQSWHAYAYVMNSPTVFVDPSGYRPEGADTQQVANPRQQWDAAICHGGSSVSGCGIVAKEDRMSRELLDEFFLSDANDEEDSSSEDDEQGEDSVGSEPDEEAGEAYAADETGDAAEAEQGEAGEEAQADEAEQQAAEKPEAAKEEIDWWEVAKNFFVNFIVGAIAGAVLAAASPVVAAVVGAVLLVGTVVSITRTAMEWSSMTPQEKANTIAGLAGGILGGGLAARFAPRAGITNSSGGMSSANSGSAIATGTASGIGTTRGFVGRIPKAPTGGGAVPKAERDPVRFFSKPQRAAKRAEQNNECGTGCGTKIEQKNSAGHHIKRHADGGKTTPDNHVEVCKECHIELHSGD